MKMLAKSLEIWENPENSSKNGTQRCLISKNGPQGLQKHMKTLF